MSEANSNGLWRGLRRLLPVAIGLAAGLPLANAAAENAPPAQTTATTGRPNILVIVTDQQFAEVMSCRMGREHIHTPAMDSLAERGMLFSRAYCVYPLCGPSRNSMFSGLYPQHVRWRPHSSEPSVYMGRYLLDAGYDTAYCGKSELFGRNELELHGFQTVGAVMSGETRRTAMENGGWDAWTAKAALEFLARPRDKPFLLVASFLNPHNICEWSRRLGGQKQILDCGEIGEPPPVEGGERGQALRIKKVIDRGMVQVFWRYGWGN